MKKQTVIEWLVEQLEQQIVLSKNPNCVTKRTGDYRIGLRHAIDLCDQAKQMEKQQRISDYYQGACDESDNHGAQYICESNAEKWYNEQKQ